MKKSLNFLSLIPFNLLLTLDIILLSANRDLSKSLILSFIITFLIGFGLYILIESISIQLDLWSWENNIILIQNFVMCVMSGVITKLILSRLKPMLNIAICLAVYFIPFTLLGTLNVSL